MKTLERPTKLSEALGFCPDRDLEAHLRAIKKAFPQAKILKIEKESSKKNLARARMRSQLASQQLSKITESCDPSHMQPEQILLF